MTPAFWLNVLAAVANAYSVGFNGMNQFFDGWIIANLICAVICSFTAGVILGENV